MKVAGVRANNRRRAFDVELEDGRCMSLPYARLRVRPTPSNRVKEAYADPELGGHGFTYVLVDGTADSVPASAVLDYNRDPAYIRDLLLHRLTVEAQRWVARSRLSKRELIRRLETSPTQLYRLLDPTNYSKSLDRMVELLTVLGADVDVIVRDRGPRSARMKRA